MGTTLVFRTASAGAEKHALIGLVINPTLFLVGFSRAGTGRSRWQRNIRRPGGVINWPLPATDGNQNRTTKKPREEHHDQISCDDPRLSVLSRRAALSSLAGHTAPRLQPTDPGYHRHRDSSSRWTFETTLDPDHPGTAPGVAGIDRPLTDRHYAEANGAWVKCRASHEAARFKYCPRRRRLHHTMCGRTIQGRWRKVHRCSTRGVCVCLGHYPARAIILHRPCIAGGW